MLPSVHTKGKVETPCGLAEQEMEELTQENLRGVWKIVDQATRVWVLAENRLKGMENQDSSSIYSGFGETHSRKM